MLGEDPSPERSQTGSSRFRVHIRGTWLSADHKNRNWNPCFLLMNMYDVRMHVCVCMCRNATKVFT